MAGKENFYYFLRPVLGIVVFLLLLIYGNPSLFNFLFSIPLVILGEFVRILAASSGRGWQRSYKLRREEIIKEGIYRKMRHPFYAGNFLIINGFLVFFGISLLLYIIIFLFSFIYFFTLAKTEEKYLGKKLNYEKYKREVPFLSFVLKGKLNKKGIKQEITTIIICFLVYIIGFAKIIFF